VGIDFDLDADETEALLDSIVEEWPRHRRAITTAIGEDLVGNLKREVPTNTGRLKSTIRTIETGESVVVVAAGGKNGVDYVRPLIEGSEPHAPGPSDPSANPSLARWASRNGYPGGFDGIYWAIANYGTEPHDFVSEPVRETDSRAGGIARQVLRNRGAFS